MIVKIPMDVRTGTTTFKFLGVRQAFSIGQDLLLTNFALVSFPLPLLFPLEFHAAKSLKTTFIRVKYIIYIAEAVSFLERVILAAHVEIADATALAGFALDNFLIVY